MSLISIPAAAEILGVSRATAYRLARDGRIPTVRVTDRIVRVHKKRLRDWIESEADVNTGIPVAPSEKIYATCSSYRSPAQLERELDELLKPRPSRKG